MSRTLIQRIHNPRGLECGCRPECWCKRTLWGRALRWYLPKRHHTMTTVEWKREIQAQRDAP